MPNTFHGQQRDAIVRHLVTKWLPNGPAVTILQGFPGCGKSQLAVSVAEKATKSLAPVEPQVDAADPVLDVLIDLALALDAKGISGLLQAFEKGGQTTIQSLGKVLLDILRQQEILVVVDEFQRLLPKDSTLPPAPWADLVEQLNKSASPRGRLLLISNRSIKLERWCESCDIEELRGLHDKEAETFFSELLEAKGLSDKVPPKHRRAIVHRLSGNPRALKTLVYALRTESLTDLIPEAPDLKQAGDVVLDARLLEEFERELLERALPKLEVHLLKFMRWLSVHRRPFQKEALAQFTGGLETPEALRQQLFDRFLLEQVPGGDAPHQLAREISVNRLRPEKAEWVQAHNLAANYHMRRFEARSLSGASTLPASYVELRHHLYESGRISEIHKVSERLTKYALSQIGLTTPVPTNMESLEERIALLSAIPDEGRPKVLEYQLARCLVRRGNIGDKENALKHVRRGTGRHPHAASWMLRLNLEYELQGIDAASSVLDEALIHVKSDEDASPIYRRGAEMMAEAGRLDEGVKLLGKGIAVVPPRSNLFALYKLQADLLTRLDKTDDAILLLKEGIKAIPPENSVHALYQACAELLTLSGKKDEAIKLICDGVNDVPAGMTPWPGRGLMWIVDRIQTSPASESAPSITGLQGNAATPDVYVSYAWGEDSSEPGRQREEIVDRLCETVRNTGRAIGRDKERLQAGDSIERFAQEISKAQRIVAVLSEKSLHSKYCMVMELYSAWRRCNHQVREFQEKVIALVMDDTKALLADDLQVARFWKEEYEREKASLQVVDPEHQSTMRWGYVNQLGEMCPKLPDMLGALKDIVMKRGFEQITEDGFREVISRLPPVSGS